MIKVFAALKKREKKVADSVIFLRYFRIQCFGPLDSGGPLGLPYVAGYQ